MKKHGEVIWNYAWGREEEETIEAKEGNKAYGNSMTTPVNVTDVEYARQILLSVSYTHLDVYKRQECMSVPCMLILPPLGRMTVAIQLSSVDFPEPLLPIIPKNSPVIT